MITTLKNINISLLNVGSRLVDVGAAQLITAEK